MVEEVQETHPVDIKGRVIQVKRPTTMQYSLMGREALRLKRIAERGSVDQGEMARMMTSVGNVFDILEGTVSTGEDKEYLRDLVYAGELDLQDLLTPILESFKPDQAPKPAVRRGSSKRS
jgi:hypothetical protein